MDQCLFNAPLTEEALLAGIDNEADETVRRHLAECRYCANKAARYKALQTSLQNIFFRQACPTSRQLTDFEAGLLNSAEQAGIRAHLPECPHCRAEIETLQAFLKLPRPPMGAASPSSLRGLRIAWQIKQARHLVGNFIAALAGFSGNALVSVPVKGDRQATGELCRFSVLPDNHTEIDANIIICRTANPELGEVWIQASIPAEWPAGDKLQITLKSPTWQQALVTDAEDKVIFTNISLAEIPQLVFEIVPVST